MPARPMRGEPEPVQGAARQVGVEELPGRRGAPVTRLEHELAVDGSISQGWNGQPYVSSARRDGTCTKPAGATRESSEAKAAGSGACSSTCSAIT